MVVVKVIIIIIMGRKTTLWAFYTINKQHLSRQNLDMAKKRKL